MSEQPSSLSYTSGAAAPGSIPPRRAVSLVPALTESLFELNLGSRLVGVTEQCVYPLGAAARLPRVGTPDEADPERIAMLRPDSVLVDSAVNPPALIARLREHGLPVWETTTDTARATLNRLWDMMYSFDETGMVERVRAIEWTCDWLERLDETRAVPCRTWVVMGSTVPVSAPLDAYSRDLLRICGAAVVEPEADGPLGQAVAAVQPDVILWLDGPADAHQHPAITGLACPAVANGAVHAVEASLLFWRGTRIGRAFAALPALLCADAQP